MKPESFSTAFEPQGAADDVCTLHLADILSGVDGIAFQINILALNAAVEAAREGEPGRGGSFVAAEVRSLARRSAEAARQVQALIANRVGHGSDLARQAVQTMDEILHSIRKVAEVATGIGASTGVSFGAAPQPGDALAGPSAAAAETLRLQAHRMVEVVDRCALRPGGAA